jgi:hypothetical protein
MVMFLTSFSQLAVSVGFDSATLAAHSQFTGDFNKAFEGIVIQKNDAQSTKSLHCTDRDSLLHCGGCMLCGLIPTHLSGNIDVSSVYISNDDDRFFFTYLDKEIKPPRI